MRAAGIFGDVAADAAHRLRRGIGGVEVSVGCDLLRDAGVDDAGFDDDALVGEIDFEDAREAREADNDAAFDGKRAAAEAGAGAARDESGSCGERRLDDGLHLFASRGDDDRAGHHAEVGEAVALVGAKLVRPGDESGLANNLPQFVDEMGRAEKCREVEQQKGPRSETREVLRQTVRFGPGPRGAVGGKGCS